jgi:hypothetical protein
MVEMATTKRTAWDKELDKLARIMNKKEAAASVKLDGQTYDAEDKPVANLGKFMRIEEVDGKYLVLKTKSEERLGEMTYQKSWKCWIFAPDNNTIYSESCLLELQKQLKTLDEILPRGI